MAGNVKIANKISNPQPIASPNHGLDSILNSESQEKKKKKKNRDKEKKKRKLARILENGVLEEQNPGEKQEEEAKEEKEEERGDKTNHKRIKIQKNINVDEGNSTSLGHDQQPQQVVRDEYPYEVNPDDHCETKVEAYEIICDFLDKIADSLHKTRQNLSIYDPYYCEGSMITALNSLGFETIYNRKEDFYEIQRLQQIPPHDVLITNPPYSDDHINRLMNYATNCNKPYFLLMPNFVYAKDYYQRIPPSKSPFYIVPTKRLQYTTPKGRRQIKSGKYTSPFPSFWYCHLGPLNPSLGSYLTQQTQKSSSPSHSKASFSHQQHQQQHPQQQQQTKQQSTSPQRVVVLRSSHLPVEVLTEKDPRKKYEKNALKRKKNKLKKKQTRVIES